MKHFLFWIAAGILILGVVKVSYARSYDDLDGTLKNSMDLEEGVVGGGHLLSRGIPIAAQRGYKTVIDLRSPQEEGVASERKMVEQYKLRYVNIPVTAVSFGPEQAAMLKAVLSQPGVKPAIIHCNSGRRVKALWALYKKSESKN